MIPRRPSGRQDLVRLSLDGRAAGVAHDDNRKLEALRRVNRQQPHRFGALLLGHGLDLPCSDELLISDEADEPLEIAAAQLLV